MSASADIQRLVSERLALSVSATLGDGAATAFPIAHGFGMHSLPPVQVHRGATLLVEGTDYSLTGTDIDTVTIAALTGAPALHAWAATVSVLRAPVAVVKRREKELSSNIDAALSNHGLAVWVMPPAPQRVTQGVPFVFVESGEIRVRIVERPATNRTGADAWDLMDDVMAGLQWQTLGGRLAIPLQLATRPVEPVEDRDQRTFDVVFEAAYGFAPIP